MEEQEVPTEHLHEHTEHAAKHGGESWTLGVALSSALLAALAAVASLQAGHHANEAMVAQIEAANQWSYFQSKSIKEAQLKAKMDIFTALDKPVIEGDKKKAEEYAADKEKIQKSAEEKEKEAAHELKTHTVFARSVTMFQIAISVGAIAALTKRRRFWLVSLVCGAVGLVFFIQSYLAAAAH
jgi:lipopolysaccharide export LptBFGC system permease protein LptF